MSSAKRSGGFFSAILLAGALGALAGCSAEPEQLAVKGTANADKLTQCVRPTEYMRRNHMELIEHQRDLTVHEGIRATDLSLAGCIDCHVRHDAQGRPVPVNAPGEKCAGCHEFVGERITCFQCHSPVPRGPQDADMALDENHGSGSRLAMTATADGVLQEVEQGRGDRR